MPHSDVHPARPDARDLADLVTRLAADYGDRAVTARAIREGHSHGEGLADAALPDVVVFPTTNEEVASIVGLCYAARVPVIAFGANPEPTIGFDQLDDLTYFHVIGVLMSKRS